MTNDQNQLQTVSFIVKLLLYHENVYRDKSTVNMEKYKMPIYDATQVCYFIFMKRIGYNIYNIIYNITI